MGPYCNQLLFFLRGEATDRTAESLGWGVIRSVLVRQILASLHPCGTLPCRLLPAPGSII